MSVGKRSFPRDAEGERANPNTNPNPNPSPSPSPSPNPNPNPSPNPNPKCLQANAVQQPGSLDSRVLLRQLRSTGARELVQVSRASHQARLVRWLPPLLSADYHPL